MKKFIICAVTIGVVSLLACFLVPQLNLLACGIVWLVSAFFAFYFFLRYPLFGYKEIYFAAGCFWGSEKYFKLIDGVISTEVGFANGNTENPTYKEVYTDTTGYAECVHVTYNPYMVSLRDLTRMYFHIIDPLSLNKQGEDEGTRYRTGVYYSDTKDLKILQREFARQQKSLQGKMAVELLPLQNFHRAEEYHQDYLNKNPKGYCHLTPGMFEYARKFNRRLFPLK